MGSSMMPWGGTSTSGDVSVGDRAYCPLTFESVVRLSRRAMTELSSSECRRAEAATLARCLGRACNRENIWRIRQVSLCTYESIARGSGAGVAAAGPMVSAYLSVFSHQGGTIATRAVLAAWRARSRVAVKHGHCAARHAAPVSARRLPHAPRCTHGPTGRALHHWSDARLRRATHHRLNQGELG